MNMNRASGNVCSLTAQAMLARGKNLFAETLLQYHMNGILSRLDLVFHISFRNISCVMVFLFHFACVKRDSPEAARSSPSRLPPPNWPCLSCPAHTNKQPIHIHIHIHIHIFNSSTSRHHACYGGGNPTIQRVQRPI
jgi:hypothetical protein